MLSPRRAKRTQAEVLVFLLSHPNCGMQEIEREFGNSQYDMMNKHLMPKKLVRRKGSYGDYQYALTEKGLLMVRGPAGKSYRSDKTSVAGFQGFSEEVFDSCKAAPSIDVARGALEQLRAYLEPRIQRLNSNLHGVVSRTKAQGTDEYNDWAWLMFTTASLSTRTAKPLGAHDLTQLTVNICNECVYAGLCIRPTKDRKALVREFTDDRNQVLVDSILDALAGREWAIKDPWDEPVWHSKDELRGLLLDTGFSWINARFERTNHVVGTRQVGDEILRVFEELYNIYALATGLSVAKQPKPKQPVSGHQMVVDDRPAPEMESDSEIVNSTLKMVGELEGRAIPGRVSVPGRQDRYFVRRTALPLELSRIEFRDSSGKTWVIYQDAGYRHVDLLKRIEELRDFRLKLERLVTAIGSSKEFVQIAVTDPRTDARYIDGHVIANLMRYEKNQSEVFWLFALLRETAYMKEARLSYKYMKILRNLLMTALSRLSGSPTPPS